MLLPKPKVQDWPHQSEIGLHGITDVDYQRNPCENYYEASDFGTPSPLGHALVLRDRLEQYLLDLQGKSPRLRFTESFNLWSLILKGIYLGLITPREVKLLYFKRWGRIPLREFELFEGFRFQFLMYEGGVSNRVHLSRYRIRAQHSARSGSSDIPSECCQCQGRGESLRVLCGLGAHF